MKRKNLLVIMLLGALGLAAGGGYIATRDANVAKPVSAGSTYDVTNANFTKYFNNSTTYKADTLNIIEDINLGGANLGRVGIDGVFTGTINGNNHTISNFTLSSSGVGFLFHESSSDAVIKDLTITGSTANAINSFGFLGYKMDGSASNLTFNITTLGGVNTGGATWGADTGTWTNCKANWTIPNTTGANMYRIGQEGSATYNNCTYTLNKGDDVTVAWNPTADRKVTLDTNVSAVKVNDVEAIVNRTVTENLTLTGNEFHHVKWTVGNTSIATVAHDSTTTSSVVVNGVSAGTTTLTAKVYADAGEKTLLASDEGKITVVTSSPVRAISVTPATASIVEGKTTNLSGALTGTTYDHITWSSGATDIATVAGDGTSATVTAVSAGDATITAKVYSAATESTVTLLATGTSAITVTAATKVDIYLYVQQSRNYTSETLVFGGTTPGGNVLMTKKTVTAKFDDPSTTDTTEAVLWDIYYGKANFTTLGIPSNGGSAWAQASDGSNVAGRWGGPCNLSGLDQTKGLSFRLPGAGTGNLTLIEQNGLVKEAIAAFDTITSSDWRVSYSICWMLTDNKTKYDSKMSTYNGLSTGAKTLFDNLYDYNTTMGETFTMLAAHPYQGSGSAFFGSNEDSNSSLVMLYTVLGIVLLGTAGGIAYIIKRKRA